MPSLLFRFLLIVLALITMPSLSKADEWSSEHSNQKGINNTSVITARPVQGGRDCVCQFQTVVPPCVRNQTEVACNSQDDCRWHRPRGNALTSVCMNWHENYCNTEFRDRPPRGGCQTIQILAESESAPNCNTPNGQYYYTFHGHGPRLDKLKNTIKSVITGSNRTCNFSFNDQSCSTFAVGSDGGLPEIRTMINNDLKKLLQGNQTVALTANQISAHSADVSAPNSQYNPSYTFRFNQHGITDETPVSCDARIICNRDAWEHRDWYFCHTGNGIQRRTCCYINNRFSWQTNMRSCPHYPPQRKCCGQTCRTP